MSAIAPRNSSPAIVVERKDAFNAQVRNAINSIAPSGGLSGGNNFAIKLQMPDVILEILVLAAAAVAIIVIAYLVFKPLFTGIFQTAIETINTITELTSETLGTVTEVLGGVIEDASGVIKTVTGTVSQTITSLSNTISVTLDSIAGPVTDVSEGGSLTKIATVVTDTVVQLTDIIVSQEIGANGKPKGIIPRLAAVIDSIIEATEKLLIGEFGIMPAISGFINDFKEYVKIASEEFQKVLSAVITATKQVIGAVGDGIRYVVDPFLNETYGIPAIASKMLGTIEILTSGVTLVGSKIAEAINKLGGVISSVS